MLHDSIVTLTEDVIERNTPACLSALKLVLCCQEKDNASGQGHGTIDKQARWRLAVLVIKTFTGLVFLARGSLEAWQASCVFNAWRCKLQQDHLKPMQL